VDNDYELGQDSTPATDGSTVITRLKRKEIENYLLEPTVVFAAISRLADQRRQRTGRDVVLPTPDELAAKLNGILLQPEIMNLVKFQVLPRYRETLPREHDPAHRERIGEEWFASRWQDESWRLRNCPGKQVLSSLREWVQKSFQVTLTTRALVDSLAECPQDLTEIVAAVRQHFYESN
jgi:hypothetical protein